MQYLLTKEEYDDLVQLKRRWAEHEVKVLQDLCTLVADHVPAYRPWDIPNKSPWGCILTKKTTAYCDHCPVNGMCPHTPKRWSK